MSFLLGYISWFGTLLASEVAGVFALSYHRIGLKAIRKFAPNCRADFEFLL